LVGIISAFLKKGGLGYVPLQRAKANAIAFSFYQTAVLDKSNEIRVSYSKI
jgi:hypothetical protein